MADSEQQQQPGTEQTPLLGGPGDASQQPDKPLYHNFVIGKLGREPPLFDMGLTFMAGTGVVAQAGAWIVRCPAFVDADCTLTLNS